MEKLISEQYFDNKSGLWLDTAHMDLPKNYFNLHADKAALAFKAMADLEKGGIANPDENRMVGHYWLRSSKLAPTPKISKEIDDTLSDILGFATKVHSGEITSSEGKVFTDAIVIGIGGSNLGPKFIYHALSGKNDKMKLHFIDNTDPSGIYDTLSKIKSVIKSTMVIVISKSGGTIETRNGMLETEHYFKEHGIDFFSNSVCITQHGSKLHDFGGDKWLHIFPMWDWVGGRTSVLSAVGLLPLSLAGIECTELLRGAKSADILTRDEVINKNPAMMLALSWLNFTEGKGGSSIVFLPYRDRLELLSKYLQQLFMESLGKELDLDGNTVKQGIAVYGNKGSTDQHSYVQQLVAGSDNMFVTFISVLSDTETSGITVGENSSSGDYLNAFMLGTEKALKLKGKRSMTVTVPHLNAFYIGMLIALFERAVGFYATLVNINAYHQPAVEYGKKAANEIIELKNLILSYLSENSGKSFTASELCYKLHCDNFMHVFKILMHLSASNKIVKKQAENAFNSEFKIK